MSTTRVRFTGGSPFLADVRQRVDAHFERSGLATTADGAMRRKTVVWLGLAVSLFVVAAGALVPFPFSLLVWSALGFVLAGIGFNIGHDAIHGSYSKTPWVNRVLARTFDVMGASADTWEVSHNQVHHSFTNIKGLDADLEPGPFMRFYPQATPPAFVHRFQHLYAWLLYGLTGVVWVFKKDFAQLRSQERSRKVALKVIAGKLAHFGIFLGVPLLLGAPLWVALVSYVVMLATAGVTLAVVFQLAHVVEGVSFPEAPADGVMDTPWAENEMHTTANFGRTALTTFITGGLDHQIEHHLFPRICHIHYPAIAPIVEACARDHGLPYTHSGSFLQALSSHARLLKRLGAGEDVCADDEARHRPVMAVDDASLA